MVQSSFQEMPFMVMFCMCLSLTHTLLPSPSHTPLSFPPHISRRPHTHISLPSPQNTHTQFSHGFPSYTHLSLLHLLHPHTVWSLQWMNLIPRTNPSLPRPSPTTNQAIIEPTVLKAAENVLPQLYPSGEVPNAQESECFTKFLHVYIGTANFRVSAELVSQATPFAERGRV